MNDEERRGDELLSLQQMTRIRRSTTVHDYTFLIRP